tara:strand:- start:50 stop:742 length:693 start_codon:yes stop_codon:yes gene_type:complete
MRFVGGEPTLHPQFVDFCKVAKASGLVNKKISVVTNGISLMSQPDEFWEAIDLISLSMYRNTNINYEKVLQTIQSKYDSHGVTYNIATDQEQIENLETVKNNYIYEKLAQGSFKLLTNYEEHPPEVAQSVFNECILKDICHSIKDGKYYRCTISTIKDAHYKAIGVETNYNFKEEDGLAIDENFPDQWEGFIKDKTININACRYCNGWGTQKEEAHRQLSMNEIKAIQVL